MQAHRAAIPVIVCCESVKFSEKVALDSIVLNEVAPSEELFTPAALIAASPKKEGEEEEPSKKEKTLADWKDIPNLQILNLMYDVTPAEYISMIVCEYEDDVGPFSIGAFRHAEEPGKVITVLK